MKRLHSALLLLLAIAFIVSFLPKAAAQGQKKQVILSTCDIYEPYKILGLVSYRSNESNPEKINAALKEKAYDMDADYVVGVAYYSNAGYLYGTGTAVKLIKKK